MLRQKITDALKDAMRNKDERGVGTIRLIMSEMKKRDIDARPSGNTEGIGETDIATMMQGMIKQRRESITMFEKGNRPDLVKQESEEISVIELFLPTQMSEDEIKAVIATAIASTGAASVKDMGKVMAVLKTTYAGQMDFAQASALVKTLLTTAA